MRNVTIGTKDIGLKASLLALRFYKQEFGTDLISDYTKKFEQQIMEDILNFDADLFLQFVWAMNRAYVGRGNEFPGFEKWLDDIGEGVNFGDVGLVTAVQEEILDGFFRTNKPQPTKPTPKPANKQQPR